MAELADALDLGSSVIDVQVQVLSRTEVPESLVSIRLARDFTFPIFLRYIPRKTLTSKKLLKLGLLLKNKVIISRYRLVRHHTSS